LPLIGGEIPPEENKHCEPDTECKPRGHWIADLLISLTLHWFNNFSFLSTPSRWPISPSRFSRCRLLSPARYFPSHSRSGRECRHWSQPGRRFSNSKLTAVAVAVASSAVGSSQST